MSLQTKLEIILKNYLNAYKENFAEHKLADFIRNELPNEIQNVITENDRYLVKGSPGQGNWAKVPWVGIFDRLITESAQDGYYLVYLFKEDFSGFYLSLNQGVTSIKNQYRSKAEHALKVRADNYLARLGDQDANIIKGQIDLSTSDNNSLGKLYEFGAICSIFYKNNEIPSNDQLSKDLNHFLNLYLLLASKESKLFDHVDAEEDESSFGVEDLQNIREHKRVERNKKLALNAKKIHGYKCKACGFDFEKIYGEIGKEFIEAHHLTPISSLKNKIVKLDAKNDFTVLCSNCHRMIHRSTFFNNIDEFRKNHISKDTQQEL